MAPGDLENALKLSRSGEEVWTAHADPNYEAANGMFGGWTTAIALRAVCEDAGGSATPAAMTVNFVSKVEPDTDMLIRARRVGGGRSVSYWQSEVTAPECPATLAIASVVLTARRDETSGRRVDHLQLAFLADHREPRSFFWSDGPRPSTTLTLSVYFHATHDELAAVGDDDVLSEAFGTRGAQSTSEEHVRLWSRQGALLATSVQMDWYR